MARGFFRYAMGRLFLYGLRFCEAAVIVSIIAASWPFGEIPEHGRGGPASRVPAVTEALERQGLEDNGPESSEGRRGGKREHEESEPQTVMLIGTEYAGRGRDGHPFISDCRPQLRADCDGDGRPEDLCVRSMIEGQDGSAPRHWLLVDVYRGTQWVMRQKLALGFYAEERYFDFVDLDEDGQPELVTRVRLGPDCAGCDAFRIHAFADGALYNVLNVFGDLTPCDARVKAVLKRRDRIDPVDGAGFDRSKKPGEAAACNEGDFFGEDCAPWLLRSEGKTVLVHTLTYADAEIGYPRRRAGVLVTETTREGTAVRQGFFEYPEKPGEVLRSAVGFLKTAAGKVHLLTTIDHSGTSFGYPLLEVLELQGVGLKAVGGFSGFYHHAIPERLVDFDGDGTTEIVSVGETIWPPGAAHADGIPVYEIAGYRKGRYSPAGPKLADAAERLNRFFE